MGSVGVGKTFLASALGHAACRAGYDVLFIRADQMFLELKQSRADYSHEKALRRFLAPDLLILDDFALRRLDTTQSNDIYEVVIERHRRSSTILTSNRHVDEWIPLFDDPILAQSALDRLSHNAYQVQIEGESYRKGQRPDLLASKLENCPPTLKRSESYESNNRSAKTSPTIARQQPPVDRPIPGVPPSAPTSGLSPGPPPHRGRRDLSSRDGRSPHHPSHRTGLVGLTSGSLE